MLKPYLFIDTISEKGRGIFTHERIPANTVIEIAPVIVMEISDREHLDKTLLHDYIFEWGEQLDHCCIGLGYVSMYNHSYKSNCIYEMDFETPKGDGMNSQKDERINATQPGERPRQADRMGAVGARADHCGAVPAWSRVGDCGR